jgi:hypothetical protein
LGASPLGTPPVVREDEQPALHQEHPSSRQGDADLMAEVEIARRRVFTAWEAASRHARFFADDAAQPAEGLADAEADTA